jgi:tetratricopeptide (TPR) repeat protein
VQFRSRRVEYLLVTGPLFALVVILSAGEASAANAVPGDNAFASMEYETALGRYEAALQSEPGRPEILWRMARLYLCLGDVAPSAERDTLYGKAVEYARLTIAADSTAGEGHTWLAAALGSMAMNEGAKRKVQLAREIRQQLEIALKLNPNDDVAHSILGSFYRALGNVSWIERSLANVFLGGLPPGGYPDAERELLAAIRIAPNEFRHYYELGRLYVDWGRPADAVKAFQHAIEVGPRMAADRERMERAKISIAELTDH